jgi:class 3 adenylate cyclase
MSTKKGKARTRLPSGQLTFMFTDIVSSSLIQNDMPGESTRERSQAFIGSIKNPHDEIINSCADAWDGTFVKDRGDGFLFVFKTAEDAVLSAVEIQERLTRAAIDTPRGPLQIRIGLNTGSGEIVGGDYVGADVNKAERVQSHCRPGQVFISSETHGLVRGKLRSLSFVDRGLKVMKGFSEKHRVFLAARANQTAPKDGDDSRSSEQKVTQDYVERRSDLSLAVPLSTPEPVVIIGDPNEERFEWFKKLMAEVYLTQAVQAKTLEEVKQVARNLSLSNTVSFRVVFLADSLPLSVNLGKADPRINFILLEEMDELIESDLCCLVTGKQKPHLDGLKRQVQIVHTPTSSTKNVNAKNERERFMKELSGLRRIRPVEIAPLTNGADQINAFAEITSWDKSDDGFGQLLNLLRASLAGNGLTTLQLTSLGKGFSGTQLFGVTVTSKEGTKKYVLKLHDSLPGLESKCAQTIKRAELSIVICQS